MPPHLRTIRKLNQFYKFICILCVSTLSMSLIGCVNPIMPDAPEVDSLEGTSLGELLTYFEKQGYTANAGFNNKYAPGTIIQLYSRGANNQPIKEISPVIFMSAEECFPEVTTTYNDVALPTSMGSKEGGYSFDASILKYFLPSLSLSDTAVKKYSMKLNEPRTELIPRGKLINSMSVPCRKAIHQATKLGDDIKWFMVVKEVIASEGFSFVVDWAGQSGAGIGYKKEVKNNLDKVISTVTSLTNASASANIKVATSSDSQYEITTDKVIYFAYKASFLDKH